MKRYAGFTLYCDACGEADVEIVPQGYEDVEDGYWDDGPVLICRACGARHVV